MWPNCSSTSKRLASNKCKDGEEGGRFALGHRLRRSFRGMDFQAPDCDADILNPMPAFRYYEAQSGQADSTGDIYVVDREQTGWDRPRIGSQG
jgi:hypothetical protein